MRKKSTLIILLSWAAYVAAYIGRLNFNAYLEPIRGQLGASKTEMGLISSFFFFSYGAGQFLHGILSRKYNTKYSVAIALVGSAAVNFAMTLCSSVPVMRFIWLGNGFFQSILWSSLIKTLADRLPNENLHRAIVVMSTPTAFGTFFIYGIAAIFSSHKIPYKVIFYLPAALLLLAGILWFAVLSRMDKDAKDAKEYIHPVRPKFTLTKTFVLSALVVIVIAIANGFIKDGVTTWTPSILKEHYGMLESLSILITVLLPLIAISGAVLSTWLHDKQKNVYILNGLLLLAETAVLGLVLYVTGRLQSVGPVPLILLFGLSAMLMSAVNNFVTSIIPMYLRDTMDSGMLAGILDTFCYVGSTMSTGLLGFLADRWSWSGAFTCLLLFSAASCLICWIFVAGTRNNKHKPC